MMFLLLHITCSCIFMHTYFTFSIFLYIELFWDFSNFLFLPPSLSPSCISLLLWHLNVNLLHPRTLFVSGHLFHLILHHLMSSSTMRRPNRTYLRNFLDKAFIRNAKSFCQTSLTLTFPLSSTVGNGGHCVTSRSPVHPCQHAWI